MKKLSILFLVVALGCGTQSRECDKVNPEQAKQIIVDFLNATNEGDYEKMKGLTTQDYLVYLDGEVFDHDKLVEFIEDFPGQSDYLFDEFDFDIESDCNSAFLSYFCVINDKNDTVNVKSYDLQSAHVIRIGDALKLNFLHSTTERLGLKYHQLINTDNKP